MPKAIVIKGPAGKPGKVYYDLAFKEVPFPQPSAHEVVVRISAASLNHRDLFIRQHLYPGTAFDVPLLADGCGVVVDTGAQALFWKNKRVILNPGSGWKASLQGPEDAHGYRILGGTKLNPIGTLQQYVCIDASEVEEAPSHLTDSEAAALPLTGLTAWRAVMVKAGLGVNVGPGRKILITGIGGGVALMALLFAVESGSDVWVTSSSDAKIEKAKKLGAKGGVNYRFPGWEMELLQGSSGTRKEFDAIIDGAGGDIIAKGVKLLKAGGTISAYGMTVSPKMDFLMQAVLKNIDVKGSTMGSRQEFADMVDFVKEKELRPVISSVVQGIESLQEIDRLFDEMKSGGQFGKLVIEMCPAKPRSRL